MNGADPKFQIITDDNGKVITCHKFGWVSETTFVSKLRHKQL